MQYKILMADDDAALIKMLKSYFEIKGYCVITAADGVETLEKIKYNPDILILDINMPGLDGIEVCRRIRDIISCPIIFLTARAEEQDKINGLLSGGDDYILKPFSLKELEARIIANMKREERHRVKSGFRFNGDMMIDYTSKTVRVMDREMELTKGEYDIVEFLSMNPGQVFDRERIYEKIFGYDAPGDSRVITELVRRIRQKISKLTDTEYIETVWGMGYRWKK